jgi:hypothetical protein
VLALPPEAMPYLLAREDGSKQYLPTILQD